jgi:hypothetical protein
MCDEDLTTSISRRSHRADRNSVKNAGSPMREAGGNSRMADSRIPRGTDGTAQASVSAGFDSGTRTQAGK